MTKDEANQKIFESALKTPVWTGVSWDNAVIRPPYGYRLERAYEFTRSNQLTLRFNAGATDWRAVQRSHECNDIIAQVIDPGPDHRLLTHGEVAQVDDEKLEASEWNWIAIGNNAGLIISESTHPVRRKLQQKPEIPKGWRECQMGERVGPVLWSGKDQKWKPSIDFLQSPKPVNTGAFIYITPDLTIPSGYTLLSPERRDPVLGDIRWINDGWYEVNDVVPEVYAVTDIVAQPTPETRKVLWPENPPPRCRRVLVGEPTEFGDIAVINDKFNTTASPPWVINSRVPPSDILTVWRPETIPPGFEKGSNGEFCLVWNYVCGRWETASSTSLKDYCFCISLKRTHESQR